MTVHVLFAAGLDWLEGLLPVLFVLFWIVSQVFNAFKAVGRGRQPPVVRPPVARAPRPAGDAPGAEEIRAELERQIGEFLGRPQPKPPAAAPGKPPATRPRAGGPAPPVLPARRAEPGRSPPRPPVAPATKPVVASTATVSGSDVARHVRDAFAHELEHLSSALESGASASAEPRRAAAATPAAELAALLRNPVTLRQLVLLREVLDRPTDRW